MQISDKKAVTIHYTLTNSSGEELDSSRNDEPMLYLQGQGHIIVGLEEALEGKQVKDTFKVTIPADKAYGERNDGMLQTVPMSMFEGIDKVEEGMQFHADASGGVGVVTVIKIDGDDVTIDGNHPLAGEELIFDVEVMGIRDATDDELNPAEHVHGEHCNH